MADNILRQSQLITTYGPGAMIDLPDCSVIVSGLQDWSHLRREKVDEPRLVAKLQRLLDVPSLDLWTPPRHEENARHAAPVGARIFPTWFIVKDAKPSPPRSAAAASQAGAMEPSRQRPVPRRRGQTQASRPGAVCLWLPARPYRRFGLAPVRPPKRQDMRETTLARGTRDRRGHRRYLRRVRLRRGTFALRGFESPAQGH